MLIVATFFHYCRKIIIWLLHSQFVFLVVLCVALACNRLIAQFYPDIPCLESETDFPVNKNFPCGCCQNLDIFVLLMTTNLTLVQIIIKLLKIVDIFQYFIHVHTLHAAIQVVTITSIVQLFWLVTQTFSFNFVRLNQKDIVL